MRAFLLAVTFAMAAVWYGPALAQGSVEERLERMEQRIRHLEERVAAQDRTIVEKDKQISALKGLEDGWFNKVEVGGVIEVEMAHENNYDGDNPNGVDVGKVELVAAAEIHDWVGSEIVLAMEDGNVIVDTAVVTLAPDTMPVSLTAGRHVVPFGVYESAMVSDPLTKSLGETGDDAIQFALDLDGVTAAAFMFKGDNDRGGDDQIENFGFSAGYALERDEVSIALGVSWINDIGEAGGFDDVEDRVLDGSMVAGGGASLVASFGGMTAIAEYVAAMKEFKPTEVEFKGKGAEPSAWMVEAGYDFELAGKPSNVSFGYQGTNEALALELPETRFLIGFSIELAEALSLSLEWARQQDYSTGDGGTGKDANTATAVLAAEF